MSAVIVIDGIIGAGKTTLLKQVVPYLESKGYRITTVKEPVQKWKDSGRLEQFYQDTNRRSYQFQTVAFHDRIKEFKDQYAANKDTTDIFILERSIFTDVLFAKMLLESGSMDTTEFEDYTNLWQMWQELLPLKPTLFIYLKPDVEVCMQRLRKRNRSEEVGVDETYQRKLAEKHDEFFANKAITIDNSQVPVLTLNTNDDFENCAATRDKICTEISDRLFAKN